jgi:hypothetical protein
MALAHDDRWKLASHLQKAIRRGLADEAEWAVRELWPLDHAYLRSRLAVVAVEDIAGAEPALVGDLFAPGWGKRALDARGGVEAVVEVARALAGAEKDRTACEMWGARRWLGEFEALHGSWEQMTPIEGAALAWDLEQPWWARALGAWRAVGTKAYFDHGETLPYVEGDPALWRAVCLDHGLTAADAAVLDSAGKAQQEPHPVFLPLAWQLRRTAFAAGQVRAGPPLLNLGKVGPWLSAALDGHTAEGRRALRQLLQANPDGRAFLAQHGRSDQGPQALATQTVAKLWFWMEGGQCDRLRLYPAADAIAKDLRQRFLLTPTPMDAQAFFGHFGRRPQAWQEARLSAMGLTPSAPRRSPSP